MKPPLAVSVVLLFALAAPSRGSDRGLWRGGERTRTADFYVANVALYQLSYTPPRGRPV
jgi:hypothetical protein